MRSNQTIRINEDLKMKLKIRAAIEKRHISDIIEEACYAYLREKSNSRELNLTVEDVLGTPVDKILDNDEKVGPS